MCALIGVAVPKYGKIHAIFLKEWHQGVAQPLGLGLLEPSLVAAVEGAVTAHNDPRHLLTIGIGALQILHDPLRGPWLDEVARGTGMKRACLVLIGARHDGMLGGDNDEVSVAVVEAIPEVGATRHLEARLKRLEAHTLVVLLFLVVANRDHPRLASRHGLDMIEEGIPQLKGVMICKITLEGCDQRGIPLGCRPHR